MTRKTFDRIMQVRLRNALWLEASYLEDALDRHSLRKAFRVVRKAVRLGLREAQGSLAYAYDRADSVRPSRRMAIHWYRKAWRNGSSSAARNLGITMRMEGRRSSAIKWFRVAISCGDPDARFDLAKIWLDDPDRSAEARRLLEEYVAAGPQQTYDVHPGSPHPLTLVNDENLGDENFGEAKRLLNDLTSMPSV